MFDVSYRSLMSLVATSTLGLSGEAFAGGHEDANDDYQPHFVAGVFLGVTDTSKDTAETIGAEVIYMATPRLGVGVEIEHLPDYGDGYEANVVLGLVSYAVTDQLRVIGGAGRDYHHGHEKPVWRAGAAYDFHLGDFHVSPSLAVDFMEDDEATVLGVVFAKVL